MKVHPEEYVDPWDHIAMAQERDALWRQAEASEVRIAGLLDERDALREQLRQALQAGANTAAHFDVEVTALRERVAELEAQVRGGVDGMTLLTRQLEAHEALVEGIREVTLHPEAGGIGYYVTHLLAEFDAAQEARG